MKPIYGKYVRAGAFLWVACLVGFFLFYLIVLGPQEKLSSRTKSKLAETQRLAQAATEAAQEKNRAALMQRVHQSRQTLDRFVTDQKSTDSLTLDIAEIRGDKALGAFSISPGGSESVISFENCRHIFGKHLSVNFTSSFNQFAAFLNALERNQPVILIDTFSITRSREEAAGHQVDMTLAVLVGKDAGTKEVDG